MAGPISKTTAIFEQPFSLPGSDEVLPPGEYYLETEISAPPDHRAPDCSKASVLVRLRPRTSYPGPARSLTVPLSVLERALGRDKLSGGPLVDAFTEKMLADPMVQLVMRTDRVSEAEIRTIYICNMPLEPRAAEPDLSSPDARPPSATQTRVAVQEAENEGMPPKHR